MRRIYCIFRMRARIKIYGALLGAATEKKKGNLLFQYVRYLYAVRNERLRLCIVFFFCFEIFTWCRSLIFLCYRGTCRFLFVVCIMGFQTVLTVLSMVDFNRVSLFYVSSIWNRIYLFVELKKSICGVWI